MWLVWLFDDISGMELARSVEFSLLGQHIEISVIKSDVTKATKPTTKIFQTLS